MNWIITGLRRAAWLALIGAAGGALWSWQRDRATPSGPPSPPEWPPLASTEPRSGTVSSATNESASTSTTGTVRGNDVASASSIVNALVDAPEARSDETSGAWVLPNADGECPDTHPVKANNNSGIYHVPGGRFYKRTNAERCYTTAEAAAADGYRAAKA